MTIMTKEEWAVWALEYEEAHGRPIAEHKDLAELFDQVEKLEVEGERLYQSGIKLLDAKHASEREAKKWFELYQTIKIENNELKAKADDWQAMRDERDTLKDGYENLLEDTNSEIKSLYAQVAALKAQLAERDRELAEYFVLRAVWLEPSWGTTLLKELEND